jgi:hypothetical protein
MFILTVAIPATFFPSQSTSAFTASIGQPYHGRLIDGVPFPEQFQGYNVRAEDRAYATPELIGALLDAVDAVRQQDPATCDLFLGDISRDGGGGINNHRSHQNGRDVDLGMFARGNRPLGTFMPMNGENLDVPKTWALIENLLRSQRVQYIFLDRRIQNLLYDYALCRGVDPTYLDHLFGGGRGSIIQHQRNHHDHMHVRFYAPWSAMAAQVGEGDEQKRSIIEMAQQAYLPKKVNYYVKGTEPSLDALAQSFGVSRKDLSRWNQLQGAESLRPGSCLVFYKRGFEMEQVRLAQSLQPNTIPEAPMVRLASLRSLGTSGEGPVSLRGDSYYRGRSQERPPLASYKVRKGDTLKSIAKRNGVEVATLAKINGLKKNGALKPGRTLHVADSKSHVVLTEDRSYAVPSKTCNPRMVRLSLNDNVLPGPGSSGSLKGDAASKDGEKIRLAQAKVSEKSSRTLSDASSSSSGSSKSANSRGRRESLKKHKQIKVALASKNPGKTVSKTVVKRDSSPKVNAKAPADREKKLAAIKKSPPSNSASSQKSTVPEKTSKNIRQAKKN